MFIVDDNLNVISDEELDNYLISNVLTTKQGSIYLNRGFGSALPDMLGKKYAAPEILQAVYEAFLNPANCLQHLFIKKITLQENKIYLECIKNER